MKGWLLVNKCFLCKVKEESINHILLDCAKAKGFMAIIVFFIWCSLSDIFYRQIDSLRMT